MVFRILFDSLLTKGNYWNSKIELSLVEKKRKLIIRIIDIVLL